MKQIYKNARKVFVWLGTAIDAESDSEDTGSGPPLFHNTGLSEEKVIELAQQGSSGWWERLWVIQEIVACDVVEVCIGGYVTPWSKFHAAIQ